MKGGQCRVDQTSDLLLTENDRQLQHFLGIGSFGHAPGPLECLDVEEAQSRQPLVHRIRCQLPLLEQCGLVLADVLRTQLIGGPVKVPGEVFDGANVTLDGGLSVVATLQFFEHDLAKMGHRETLLSLPATLDQLTPNCSPMTRASVRRSTASFKSSSGPLHCRQDLPKAHVPEAGLNEAALRRTLPRARSERHGRSETRNKVAG